MGLTAIVYTTKVGNSYTFYNNSYTNIFDENDIKYFEKHSSVAKYTEEVKIPKVQESIKIHDEKKPEKVKKKDR